MEELREKIFDWINDQPCYGCEFWEKQGHWCFLKDLHKTSVKCKLLDQILALIKEAGYKSPEEIKQEYQTDWVAFAKDWLHDNEKQVGGK